MWKKLIPSSILFSISMRRAYRSISLLAERASWLVNINPAFYFKLMKHWFDAMSRLGLEHGASFDLDFHTIPFHGEDALLEKHYVSKRSRRQKGILAFLAQDGDKRFFCYANTDLRKSEQANEVLQFVRFWKRRTGVVPEELIFDSKLTTYANLSKLNRQHVNFITLRRRDRKLMDRFAARPSSSWRRIELDGVSRIYKTPRDFVDFRRENAHFPAPMMDVQAYIYR